MCESHGATFQNKKLGTFGTASNFSFYYAHHLSTIEGGMVCTNNIDFYEILRMLRGHGMLRESKNKNLQKKNINKYKDLSPNFIFMYPGYNMRSNEISAVIGLNQLKRLDKNNQKRNKNLNFFLNHLNKKIFYTDFDLNGCSNYAFPIILKKKNIAMRDKLERKMRETKIEFRRGNAGGGNQLRQPYLRRYKHTFKLNKFPNVEHVHFFGYYIGNYPDLSKNKIFQITKVLNSI